MYDGRFTDAIFMDLQGECCLTKTYVISHVPLKLEVFENCEAVSLKCIYHEYITKGKVERLQELWLQLLYS